jgi:hypothetical protein
MLLALAGNALMVPRALHTRDLVWFAGSTWACAAGWGQLLSMALGASAATGWVAAAAAAAAAASAGGCQPSALQRSCPFQLQAEPPPTRCRLPPVRRAPYLPWPAFAGLSALLAAHLGAAAALEARFRGLGSPLRAVAAVFGTAA